jgi:hypothetical protein
MEEELRLVVGRLETFAAKVYNGLQQADFQTRREIIRSLVKRVEVDQQHIRIVFRVSPTSVPPSSDSAPHHCKIPGGVYTPVLSLATTGHCGSCHQGRKALSAR